MEIMLTDRYKLKTHDKLNFRLWELRDVKKLDKPVKKGGKPTGEVVVEWMPLEAYFQDVPSAVLAVYKQMQRDDPYKGELAGALDRMENMAAQLAAAASLAEVPR